MLNDCSLSYDASYVFSHADSINLCSGGKFEFLIDEVAKPIYIDDYNFLRNAHEILIPHQSKDIMIQKKDGTWTDFDKAIDINIAAIKSKSGEKVLRFEFHYTLFGCIDVILNPKENGIYKGKGLNPINETMVVVYSWYPINFSQFWNYSNYKTITIYDSIDRNRLQDDHYFIGVTCVSLRISTLSSAELGFAFYNFS
ncbi:hypothetical protein TVAG_092540 [Trichomonas vaginalis G3]|uniref:Uncharacterized protein n=1 Tax=Trichomonas vaginalis (strain ATCC PRA-98 / G3) TaxID=412133 RepID=A2F7D0_TRIV3|nr:hypothetical protein TVAGG3_0961820 [Trichomonas vaginalis G3]EAX99198.1 hypothetical protein TVAG_092540 [Trichomonas vaginalis G3]KAI5487963.1 hypothetical protein TVAGG3_0961820 [Trichomonas vaginalis G3]|eukprot:XP_001312128.1 hypothetical protein [Trichomonas vaginalis G3]